MRLSQFNRRFNRPYAGGNFRRYLRFLIVSMLLLGLLPGQSALSGPASLYVLNNENDYSRFESLTKSLRCMVCQNESLDGSQSQLAMDLKHRIADMLNAQYTDAQIKTAMTERYGEYILYQPRVSIVTIGLWVLPGLLLLIALGVIVKLYRKSG